MLRPMFRVEVDAVVRRPIDVVFDRLVDLAAYPEWMSNAGIFAGRERRLTVDALKRSLEAEGPEQAATGAPDRVAPDAGTH